MNLKEDDFQNAFNQIHDCTDALERAFHFLFQESKDTDVEIDLQDALFFAQKLNKSIRRMLDRAFGE